MQQHAVTASCGGMCRIQKLLEGQSTELLGSVEPCTLRTSMSAIRSSLTPCSTRFCAHALLVRQTQHTAVHCGTRVLDTQAAACFQILHW